MCEVVAQSKYLLIIDGALLPVVVIELSLIDIVVVSAAAAVSVAVSAALCTTAVLGHYHTMYPTLWHL